MSVLRYRLVGTKFQLCCEVSIGTRCKEGDVSGLIEHLQSLFEVLSSYDSAIRFIRKLHTTVAHGSSPRKGAVPQPPELSPTNQFPGCHHPGAASNQSASKTG